MTLAEDAVEGSLIGQFPDYQTVEEGFGAAFVDVDEVRAEPVPHRYLHGGFAGTRTLFSFYLPPAELYRGRVLQYLEGGSGGHENILAAGTFGAPWQYGFAFDELGAVLVESNQGHGSTDGGRGFENDVYLFGASAESARFAKWVAGRLYGSPVEHCYVFGASGGGHRSFQCIMRRPDVYDGGVPEVFGVNPGPYWSALGNAVTALGADVEKVEDALEPGGSGDPFAGLSFGQREALRDLLRMGFPRGAATQLGSLGVETFTLFNTMEHLPRYFEDFWTGPGHLGHDHPERVAAQRVRLTTTVKGLNTGAELSHELLVAMMLATAGAQPMALFGARLDVEDPQKLFMARLRITSGKAAGREMVITRVLPDGVVLPFAQMCPEMFDGVEPGDQVEVDNRDWVAFCQLHQHTVEWNVPGLHTRGRRVPPVYERFAVDGVPVHLQSPASHYDLDHVDPFPGKMIFIGAVEDVFIWPTKIAPFDQYVREVLGGAAEEHYRLWWVENSTHMPAALAAQFTRERDPKVWETRLVDYEAAGAAALIAVRDWVERGVPPAPSTTYTLSPDNALVIPGDPAVRGGVQPAVELTVAGGRRAEVRVGEPVVFEGVGRVPTGGGTVVEAALDVESTNTWPYTCASADGTATEVRFTATHAFTEPGTYFPSFRVGSHRDGAGRRGDAVRNLARVRVVVSP